MRNNNYFDEFRRLHHKPVTNDNPLPSNNGWWYSGIYEVITGIKKQPYSLYFWVSIRDIKTLDISRHPMDFSKSHIQKAVENAPPLSKDELFGLNICMQGTDKIQGLCKALKINNWCFGGVKGLPYWHLYWIPLAIFEGIKFKLRKEHRNAVWQKPKEYKWLRQMAFRLMPWDIYYMKRSNGVEPTRFETFMWNNYLHDISDSGSKSSKNLVIGRLYHLGEKKLANELFDVEQCMKDYFPADHPIVEYFN